MSHLLDTPIEFLKGVGPQRAELLKKELGIFKFIDLAQTFPFRYVDRTQFYKVRDIQGDMPSIQLKGRLGRIETTGKKRANRLVATFYDDTGAIELVWFKGINWVKPTLKEGMPCIVFGKPTFYGGKINIAHPELEQVVKAPTTTAGALQPVYSTTEKLSNRGLSSKGISKLQQVLIPQLKGYFPENLPRSVLDKLKLVSREQAMQQIHFPTDPLALQRAQLRLKFEELFFVQLQLLLSKHLRQARIKGLPFPTIGDYFQRFYSEKLPFPLTGAQKRVIKEIRRDLGSGIQMNRLLQGDVGSGKTVVGLMVMLIALDNGYQSALMAPTEILANQHYEGISELVAGLGVNVGLLTGSTKAAQRKPLHEMLRNGEMHILIGTHALIEDKVQFKNLGLTVIDEQHRFGVAQRSKLWRKNTTPPHVLVMTATPIPRTLAMTLYGDLDVSVIDEMPPGRKPIKTIHRFESGRLRAFGFMKEQIAEGRQVYVVYPLIQESEKMDYKDLQEGYESILRSFPRPDYQVSILHGKMKAKDKDYEMERFASGETNILVATTVIEVGVNVPNATVMVIESAERFGLSQLHQLRGRVGRGGEQSYCVLLTGNKLSTEGKQRMEIMVRTTDGFEIAEEDLRIRGPGNLMGTQQSGVLDLQIADLAKDGQILRVAREEAMSILDQDPGLQLPEHRHTARFFQLKTKNQTNWSRIS